MINYDKEYHPVIEDYICDYAEGNMDEVELNAFEEVREMDEELRELSIKAKKGRSILQNLLYKAI